MSSNSKSGVRMYMEPYSPHSQLAMFVIGLKQLPVEMVGIGDWLNKPKELFDNNPFKKIPTLIDGNFSMYESRAICRYLDKRFPNHGPKLVPIDIHDYGKMEQWCSVEAHHYEPEMRKLIRERIWAKPFTGKEPDEKECVELVKKLIPIMEIINNQLGKTTYFVGSNLTIADVVFLPLMHHLITIPEKSQLFDPYPNIVRWWSTISSLPAWQHIQEEEKKNKKLMDENIARFKENKAKMETDGAKASNKK